MSIPKAKLPELYRRLFLCRAFEDYTIKLFMNSELPGFLHSQKGQEAIPVGVSACLEDGDFVQPTHRGHADMLSKGMDPAKMMAELYAKKTGYNQGKSGSMHMASIKEGVIGATGIVGSGPTISIGAALALQMDHKPNVVISYFGDGASNEGSVHESIGMAALWNLPIVFIIQNNQFAESTPRHDHQKVVDLADRGKGYGIDAYSCDGNDVFSVFEVASKAVKKARAGGGPSLINAVTYRIMGHYVGDPGTLYRNKEEVEEAKGRDPVINFRNRLIQMKVLTMEQVESIEKEVNTLMDEAVAFGKASPEPADEELFTHIYS
ncbi:MAG TPA: thiamine pyrophosphate-dependent dehydrogenase E1 component subunit alpha [Methanocellales archaeon]|nr:thiamine pyrophosphate-dependent dehydrogenase E1 component subunit alpha [Methanocellales archaeon]